MKGTIEFTGQFYFQLAQNRAVRQVFSKFRSEHLDAFNWNASQVPELVVLNEEHLAREAEKKRIQREKKKQRDKAKKAALLLKKAEQVVGHFPSLSGQVFLKLVVFRKTHQHFISRTDGFLSKFRITCISA